VIIIESQKIFLSNYNVIIKEVNISFENMEEVRKSNYLLSNCCYRIEDEKGNVIKMVNNARK
jgi:hypothetical protein